MLHCGTEFRGSKEGACLSIRTAIANIARLTHEVRFVSTITLEGAAFGVASPRPRRMGLRHGCAWLRSDCTTTPRVRAAAAAARVKKEEGSSNSSIVCTPAAHLHAAKAAKPARTPFALAALLS